MYNVKLTDKEVYHILWLNQIEGLLPYQIEQLYSKVSRTTIKNIINGKTRKDCYYSFMDYKKKHPRKIKSLFD